MDLKRGIPVRFMGNYTEKVYIKKQKQQTFYENVDFKRKEMIKVI